MAHYGGVYAQSALPHRGEEGEGGVNRYDSLVISYQLSVISYQLSVISYQLFKNILFSMSPTQL